MISETGGSAIVGLFEKHGQTQGAWTTASAEEFGKTDSIPQSECEDRLLGDSLGAGDERDRVRPFLDPSTLVSVVRRFGDDSGSGSEAGPVDTEACFELIAADRFPRMDSSVLRENVK